MKEYKIFAESKADVVFLNDYMIDVFGEDLNDEDFDTLGSWSGYKAGGALITSIKENFDNNKKTVLILDADTSYDSRKNEIVADFASYNIPIKLFLFPNNKDQGALEDLLSQIAVHKEILDCFESYEKCISGHNMPVIKSKIFAYLDALLPAGSKKGDKNDQIQDKNRNYCIKEFWDLHHHYLAPLKLFIEEIHSGTNGG